MKTLIMNAAQIATPIGKTAKHGSQMSEIRIIKNGAIYIEDEIIKKVGTTEEVLAELNLSKEVKVINAFQKAIIPGFVDSHTHFVFGGYREDEFIDRLQGIPYLDLLKRGGGIMKTVTDTRNASFEDLYESGLKRLKNMLKQGVTTTEGKSGYGLNKDCEIKQLKVMCELNKNQPVDIVSTYLGAHAVAQEYKNNTNGYVDYMINEVLPEIKKENLAEFCDVFCEEGVFSIDESKKLLEAAQKLGFKAKLHADEIVPLNGAELAAQLKAVSADHLLMISQKGIESLAKENVIATLLPCTAFCLDKPYAPARKIIDGGCAVSLASDLNPGSCFSNSLPLIMALAVIHMKMTIEEALTAVTLNAAAALDRAWEIGSIEVGKKADLVILEYPSYKFLVYNTGANIVEKVIKNGEIAYENSNY